MADSHRFDPEITRLKPQFFFTPGVELFAAPTIVAAVHDVERSNQRVSK